MSKKGACFRDRVENSSFQLMCFDGVLEMVLHQGGMMGSSEAPVMFLRAFAPCVAQWNMKMYSRVKPLVVRCPFTQRPHDLSLVGFADDLARRIPLQVRDGTARQAWAALEENGRHLAEALSQSGWCQNFKNRGGCT